MTTKKCNFCGNEFQPTRSDAKFCSTTCKARAWDQKKKNSGVPSVQNTLRGVIDERTPKQADTKQTNLVEIKDPNPLRKQYFQQFSALHNQKARYEKELKDLETRRNSVGTNYDGLAEMAFVSGGTLFASHLSDKLVNTFFGAIAGELAYQLVKPSPAQRAIAISEELEKIAVQERKVNVSLTSINIEIAVLKQKFHGTPPYIIRIVEKPAIALDACKNTTSGLPVPIRPQDVKLADGESKPNEAIASLATSEKIKTSKEVGDMEFKALGFKGDWQDFIGSPALDFSMVIHGLPGQGKSTFALLFALYLAESFGKVVYITAEEGFSKTMQDKLKLNKAFNEDLHIADLRSLEEIKTAVKTNTYNFIFIDSLNILHIDTEELRELRNRYKGAAMITVSQSTKDGKLRGSQEIVHDCDIAIEVTKGIARTTKNRFQATPRELAIFKRLS